MIKLERLNKSYDDGQTWAVHDVNLEVAEGEIIVLLGSSGCGKTTCLKMINRLIEPTSGTIEIDGRNVIQHHVLSLRRSIGYVFQEVGLFPHMTIEENVSIVPRLLGWDSARRHERAQEILSLVELDPAEFARRYPANLSGGQQQRVGVARALAADPDYLLMDEPFGALDALTRGVLQEEVRKIKERLHKTIVFVTHDILEALSLGDRIAVMHEGELQQVDKKEKLINEPATSFVKALFEKTSRQLEIYQGTRQ